MTEPTTRCECPPLRDLIATYNNGDDLPCQVHRPTHLPPLVPKAHSIGPTLVSRIRGALGPGEHFRGDTPDTDPNAA